MQTEFLRELIETGQVPDEITFDDKDVFDIESNMAGLAPRVYQKPSMVARSIEDKDIKLGALPLYKIKYALSKEQQEKFIQDTPGYRCVYDPVKKHDHPLSHMWQRLNREQVIGDMGNKYFIDLFANPSKKDAATERSFRYAGKFTGKDYIRDIHSDGTCKPYVSCDDINKNHPNVGYVLLDHTMYYLDIEDIATLCYGGKIVKAIVHRHDKVSGKINGELDYVVDSQGFVTQVTPNGEQYTHRTLNPYFKQYEAYTDKGIIAWTAHDLSGDTYVLTFVACPGFKPKYPIPTLVEPKVDTVIKAKVIKKGSTFDINELFGYTWLSKKDDSSIVLDNMEFFEELRKYISMSERSAQKMKDLAHYARRLTDKNDLFAKHSDKYYDIPVNMRAWYVQAAFYEDIQQEVDAMLTYRRANLKQAELHTKLATDLSHKSDTIAAKVKRNVDSVSRLASGVKDGIVQFASLTGADQALLFLEDGMYKHPVMDYLANGDFDKHVDIIKNNAVQNTHREQLRAMYSQLSDEQLKLLADAAGG